MPVIETFNEAKSRIDVRCSADPNHRDHRALGYIDTSGDYHLPDGTVLPATGGVTDPQGVHRRGAERLIVRPDGSISTTATQDGLDQKSNLRQSVHAVDIAQQDAYDKSNATTD